MAGLGIPICLVLAAAFWRRLKTGERRIAGWSIASALYWACFLIYVLAIDPKPRMMFVPVALTALALAVLLGRLEKTGSAPFVHGACRLLGGWNRLYPASPAGQDERGPGGQVGGSISQRDRNRRDDAPASGAGTVEGLHGPCQQTTDARHQARHRLPEMAERNCRVSVRGPVLIQPDRSARARRRKLCLLPLRGARWPADIGRRSAPAKARIRNISGRLAWSRAVPLPLSGPPWHARRSAR